MLARRDVARVARDADHFVAAVEQFLGDGATGVAGDAEDDGLGHHSSRGRIVLMR
jgi:hypothetical protein